MSRLDIEKCNDIDELRDICLRYYKALFCISETLVDESKCNISKDKAIEQIRTYLTKYY